MSTSVENSSPGILRGKPLPATVCEWQVATFEDIRAAVTTKEHVFQSDGAISWTFQNAVRHCSRDVAGKAVCYMLALAPSASRVKNKWGRSPLHRTAFNMDGGATALRALTAHGALLEDVASTQECLPPSPKRRRLSSSSLRSSGSGSSGSSAAEYLATSGINNQTVEGSTPLHQAALTGSVDCVRQLMLCGADRKVIDDEGCTPAYYAELNFGNNTLLTNLLRSFEPTPELVAGYVATAKQRCPGCIARHESRRWAYALASRADRLKKPEEATGALGDLAVLPADIIRHIAKHVDPQW